MSNKWNMVDHKPYPDRLLQRVPEDELPAVDMFVTTADAELEPLNRVWVILENKEEHSNQSVPLLVYTSREKRPKHSHHAKAGATNVLTRVSGLMTNAPYMLNVDCDMFVNNPNIILHAMCMLLEPKSVNENAYLQCPQVFYDALKDDPLGNQMIVLWKYVALGISGIQGPFYSGTGCVHRRKVIYGLFPNSVEVGETNYNSMVNGILTDEELLHMFGSGKYGSTIFKSAGIVLLFYTLCRYSY